MNIKDFNNISIRWQLMIICILLVTVPSIIVGINGYNTARNALNKDVEASLDNELNLIYQMIDAVYSQVDGKVYDDLRVARGVVIEGFATGRDVELDETEQMEMQAVNQVTGQVTAIKIPVMKINNEKVAYNYYYVDKVKNMVGGTVTIFQLVPQGMVRISTNVLKTDGTRAVGTYIAPDSPVYQAVMRGETYRGRAFVVDQMYLSAYEPIKDKYGTIIGMLYVGVKEADYQKLLTDKLAHRLVGESGYFFVIDKEGNYVLSQNRQRDGENIIGSQDSTGRFFIKEWIQKGPTLREGESLIDKYPWKNTGETTARMKMARVTYFPEWEWVIGASAYEDDLMKNINTLRNNVILICLLAIAVGSIISYLFATMITDSIKKLVGATAKLADGDLRITIEDKLVNDKSEIGTLARAFGKMVSSLKDVMGKISQNANITATSSEGLSASAEEVNASMEQVTSTIQEIAKGAQTVSKGAMKVQDASKKTSESSQAGSKSAMLVNEKMASIKDSTKQGAEKIKALGQKSDQIGKIVDTIQNISEQTNLLALNAAIEAARAGEAGRGFAVVADEVRKLAEESGKASGQIGDLILGIQKEIDSAVETMDSNVKQVEAGSAAVIDAMSAFEIIPTLIQNVNTSLSEMTAVAEENAAGSEEVASSVQEVNTAMQSVANDAQKLSKASEELQKLVSHFKVSEQAGATGVTKQ